MDYGAITIDTSIFDQKGLRLESGILKTLEQFNGKPSHLVLSEIVVREVHSHLKRKASDSRDQVVKAIRESILSLSVSEESAKIASESLVPAIDDAEVAKKRLLSFIEKTGAEIIPATGRVGLDEIIKKYFAAEAPFAPDGSKKNEFPDAIALMSLESWAKEHQTKILAVAKDGDWKRFSDESEFIDVVEDLAEAIAAFQPHSAAMEFCTHIAGTLPNGEPPYLYEMISQYVSDAVGEMDLYPDASSQFCYEPDYVEVMLDEFEFLVDEGGNAILQPVQGQNGKLIVEAKVMVTATASTSFSLTVRDSIDKDYVPIGNALASTELQFESEILLTFEGNFEVHPEDIELTDFELLSCPSDVDFGEIEPDWWHE
ncbi:PIN domain-containing protein [Shewanella putrefaciens]|nr:PIN domain-containing protein [Shewanella putrefaciens]